MSQWRNGASCGGRQTEEGQNQDEASSSSQCVTTRDKRRQQRENKLKTKELSEEEMLDLALQLSQQEASVAALQLQRREEEDVMKAIQESIILQACRPQSPSLQTDEEAPGRTCSRQKLSYSNGTIVLDDDESSSSEMQQTSRQSGQQKRKPGSSLQKKPDLVQIPDLHLEPDSPGSSDVLDPILHSPQSSDSTLIDDSQPLRSPVFPSTCCRAQVVIPRLSQELVQSCRTSGFVLCSQEMSVCNGAKNPTFPQRSRQSLLLSEKDQGDMRALSPEPSGFNFCSQDSLSSSVTSTFCQSPVFPRTGPSFPEMGQTKRSPVFQETETLQTSRSLNKTQIPAAALSPPHQNEDVSDLPGSGVEVMTNLDEAKLSSNMTLCWSDEDGEVTPVVSPSPVFPAEAESQQAALQSSGPNCRQELSIAEAQPISSQAALRRAGHPVSSGSTVHYYWGIPFCPKGLDPDGYTQVIVAQMEVFEKSLKMAQRSLLRKAEWGEGIEPQPEEQQESECVIEESEDLLPQRRLGRKKRSHGADSPSAGAEEDDNEEVEQRESRQEGSRGMAEAEEEMETEDTEVPETQLSVDDEDENAEGLIMMQDVRAELKSDKPPDVQTIVLESPPAEGEEAMEEEATVAEAVRQAEGNSPERKSSLGGLPPCDEEAEIQAGASPLQEVAPDVQKVNVDCPICQGSFPVDQIEVHAAYCDGAPADSPPGGVVPVAVKPRRKRTRRCEPGDGASGPAPSTSREHMKCFICQSAIPVQDYSRHTDLCISRQDGASAAKENLLSALEKTDSRHSDVRSSGSRLQQSDVIDLRNEDSVPVEEEGGEVGGMSSITISNSPIRSFTPISEAKDCLIDFRRPQRSKKLGRRRR